MLMANVFVETFCVDSGCICVNQLSSSYLYVAEIYVICYKKTLFTQCYIDGFWPVALEVINEKEDVSTFGMLKQSGRPS